MKKTHYPTLPTHLVKILNSVRKDLREKHILLGLQTRRPEGDTALNLMNRVLKSQCPTGKINFYTAENQSPFLKKVTLKTQSVFATSVRDFHSTMKLSPFLNLLVISHNCK